MTFACACEGAHVHSAHIIVGAFEFCSGLIVKYIYMGCVSRAAVLFPSVQQPQQRVGSAAVLL